MINVYIISGFLGSGKTTFIQKLLSEKKFEKVMLLENEFGEVGVDSAFFSSSLNIKEINNGCICCSLQGDFESALEEIEAMNVTDLIIEPSGIGKLSEIINVVKQDEDFRIVAHICIVDVKTAKKYHTNFKEYFDDQVSSANAIILSHTDVAEECKIDETIDMIKQVNDFASITTDYQTKSIDELLDIIISGGEIISEVTQHHHHHHDHDEECCCGHHHHDEDEECECHHHHDEDEDECCCGHHHDEDDECECHHHHDEDEECECHHHDHDEDEECECHHHHHHHDDETFKNVVFTPSYIFTQKEIEDILDNLDEDVIRCKGYVQTNDGTLYFNYVLNEKNVYLGEHRDNSLVCIIGSTLHESQLKEVFHG